MFNNIIREIERLSNTPTLGGYHVMFCFQFRHKKLPTWDSWQFLCLDLQRCLAELPADLVETMLIQEKNF